MKTITLIRHAKSSWADPSLSDFERPLKERGLRDAPLMGKIIAKQIERPDLILCSPARRTTQTIELIIREAGYPGSLLQMDDRLYHANPQTVNYLLAQCDESNNHVFVVGHNPTITDYLNRMTGELIENVPTCGVAQIQLDIGIWKDIQPGKGTLLFYDVPKNHKEKHG